MVHRSVDLRSQQFLARELSKLKKLLPSDTAQMLTVCWAPGANHKLSGEVLGSKIVIYDEDPREAIGTLKHEYLDFLLTGKMIEPLTAIINSLLRLETHQIYREKERIVNCLSKLIQIGE